MIKCDYCGKEFEASPYKIRKHKKGIPVYCSNSCASKSRYDNNIVIDDEFITKIKEMFYNTELTYVEIQKCSGLSQNDFKKIVEKYNIRRSDEMIKNLKIKHMRDTMEEKYGVINSMEIDEFKDKIKKTKSEKYGDENYNNINKIQQTKLEKYGDENYNNNEKTKQTNLDKYGKTTPLQTNEAREKAKQTSLERYGVDNPFKSPEIHQKAKQIIQEKYGVDSTLLVPEVREKIKNTNIKRYGTYNAFKNENIKQKQFNTIKERYGVEYACQLEQCANASPKTHSKPNEKFKKILKPDKVEIPIEKFRYDMLKRNTLIEINPTYTHNSYKAPFGQPKHIKYHLEKTLVALKHNYKCIHIFDWDDVEKIKYLLQDKNILYARKLDIKEVSLEDTAEFLNKYHLQNNCKGQIIRFGLYKGDELIELMTFGKPRYNKNYEWELLRLCTKPEYKVVGGAEKLFKQFIDVISPQSIISYCDFSKFSGEVYTRLGFKQKGSIVPSKHWSRGSQHITDNLLRQRGYDQLFNASYGKGTSNEELMIEHGWLPIYDCGQITFIWNK